MYKTYDKSKGGNTRELQSRMVPPKKTGSSHLKIRRLTRTSEKRASHLFVHFFAILHDYKQKIPNFVIVDVNKQRRNFLDILNLDKS